MTKHSWISIIDANNKGTSILKFQELNYNVEKGCYVGIDKETGEVWYIKNLTLDSLQKLENIIFQDLLKEELVDVWWSFSL